MDYKVYNGVDFTGRDFSEADIRYSVFVNCDMRGIRLPATLYRMKYVSFIGCRFDIMHVEGHTFLSPLYWAKYRLCNNKWFNDICEINLGSKEFYFTFTWRDLTPQISPPEVCVFGPMKELPFYYGFKALVTASKDNPSDYIIPVVAKLKIYRDTPAVVFEESKCRAERVIVESIQDFNHTEYDSAINYGYEDITLDYKVGKEVVADSFDSDAMIQCTNGIHFFLTEREAWEYAIL